MYTTPAEAKKPRYLNPIDTILSAEEANDLVAFYNALDKLLRKHTEQRRAGKDHSKWVLYRLTPVRRNLEKFLHQRHAHISFSTSLSQLAHCVLQGFWLAYGQAEAKQLPMTGRLFGALLRFMVDRELYALKHSPHYSAGHLRIVRTLEGSTLQELEDDFRSKVRGVTLNRQARLVALVKKVRPMLSPEELDLLEECLVGAPSSAFDKDAAQA